MTAAGGCRYLWWRALMKQQGVVVAEVMDAVPTEVLVKIYDLADRAAARWAERARMVQLCHDAGFGSWKRLRGLKDEELEKETMAAVWVLAGRERAKQQKQAVPKRCDDGPLCRCTSQHQVQVAAAVAR